MTAPTTATADLLTVEEVAKLTRTPEGTLRYWRHRNRGEGPKCFKLGRRVVYLRADVDQWLADRYANATA